MAARRVFIIWTHPLFHESVRLILNHPDIEWLGGTSDYTAAPDKIAHLRPDTVLFEESPAIPATHFLEPGAWNYRLIGLNLEDNRMHLYNYTQENVIRASDLLTFILED
jgi:DNA-binding NarL/FixJ family response regulator